MTPETVVRYWEAAGPARWFTKDPAFDGALAVRFGEAVPASERLALARTIRGLLGAR